MSIREKLVEDIKTIVKEEMEDLSQTREKLLKTVELTRERIENLIENTVDMAEALENLGPLELFAKGQLRIGMYDTKNAGKEVIIRVNDYNPFYETHRYERMVLPEGEHLVLIAFMPKPSS